MNNTGSIKTFYFAQLRVPGPRGPEAVVKQQEKKHGQIKEQQQYIQETKTCQGTKLNVK